MLYFKLEVNDMKKLYLTALLPLLMVSCAKTTKQEQVTKARFLAELVSHSGLSGKVVHFGTGNYKVSLKSSGLSEVSYPDTNESYNVSAVYTYSQDGELITHESTTPSGAPDVARITKEQAYDFDDNDGEYYYGWFTVINYTFFANPLAYAVETTRSATQTQDGNTYTCVDYTYALYTFKNNLWLDSSTIKQTLTYVKNGAKLGTLVSVIKTTTEYIYY